MANQQQVTLNRKLVIGYVLFLVWMVGTTVAAWLWPYRTFRARMLELAFTIIGAGVFVYFALRNRAS